MKKTIIVNDSKEMIKASFKLLMEVEMFKAAYDVGDDIRDDDQVRDCLNHMSMASNNLSKYFLLDTKK